MDMSTAILALSENGELEKIHKKWLNTRACGQSNTDNSDQLQLKSFWGLFVMCGIACFLALLVYFCLMLRKFSRYFPQLSEDPSPRSGSKSIRIKRFLSFVDEKEEELKNKLKRKHMEGVSRGNVEDQQSPSCIQRIESSVYQEGRNGNSFFYRN